MKRTWRTHTELMAMAMAGAHARLSATCLPTIATFGYGDVVTVKHNSQVRPTGLGGSTG